jgi:hypothetical protein
MERDQNLSHYLLGVDQRKLVSPFYFLDPIFYLFGRHIHR